MTSIFLEETNKDFKEFIEASPITPPKDLQEKIFAMVHKDLNPNPWFIFSKLALIHLLVGMVTLSLCPQFGFRFFGKGPGLMKFFLIFGDYGCTILCGGFFVGTSLFVSGFFLRTEDLNVLRSQRWLQVSALTFLSLGAFLMLHTEVLFLLAAFWVVGSILGGIAMLELGHFLRVTFLQLGSQGTAR